MQPMPGQVLIVLDPERQVLASGLVLPERRDRSGERSERGVVVAVGEPKLNGKGVAIPPEVQAGALVLTKSARGTEMTLPEYHNARLLLIAEEHILAVLSQ